MNEENLFHQALELPPRERAAFLDAACGGDHALRRRLDQLLRAHDDPGSFLKDPLLPSSGSTPVGEVTQALEAVAPKPSEGAGTLPDRGAASGADELSFLAPSERPDALGRLEHYHILEIIGRGGFGTVLKAFDEKLHRVVAIKVLSPELAASGTARQRFIREARTAAAVTHEHVVTIHAVVEEHRPPYLVMQLIDGVTLQEKLDEVGMLGLREILRIGMQAAEGLAAAHKQGLVHRDIKPANILLENGVERVKITDFGLARAVDDATVTQSGVVAGTPMYMSPEQAEGLPLDHRSDLFSLGTVLYVMCTGRPPFRASGTMAVLKRVIEDSPRPIREINPDIPDWLCDIIGKLHAKKPAERYPTAREVADLLSQRLADVQAGRAIPRHGEPGPPRTESLPRRAEPRQGPDAPSTTPRFLSRAGAPGSPKRRTLLAAIALLALTAGGLALTEWTGLTRILGRPATYELTLLVERSADQPDLPTIRYGAARDKETPDEFAERFREMARKQHFADAGIAITAFGGNKLSLPAGTKWWILCEKNGDLLYHKLVTVDRSQEVHLPWATELANRQKVDSKTEPGWVQLFNGKDLKDWEMSPADGWKIENGLLVSNGRRASISLRKPLFGDGICRLEYKLAEHATANLGVRTQAKKPKAALWLGNGKEDEKSGSIVVLDARAGSKIVAMSRADVHRKDEWQVAELIMRGNEMIVKIDGLETARHTFADLPARGNVGLYVSPGLMQIREIAIKELPAAEPGWVQLFNGKDLAGWNIQNRVDGVWAVDDFGVLKGSAKKDKPYPLFGVRSDFKDFHLRAKTKVVPGGKGTVFVRIRDGLAWKGVGVALHHLSARDLEIAFHSTLNPVRVLAANRRDLRADMWFDLDIIARGPRIEVKIDGVSTVDHTFNPEAAAEHDAEGGIVFEVADPFSTLAFSRIEIKELSPQVPAFWMMIDPHQDSKIDHQGRRATFTLPGKFRGMSATQVNRTTDAPRLVRTIEGDFDLRAKLAPLPKLPGKPSTGLGSGSIAAGLLLQQDDENFLTLFQTKLGGSDKGMVYLQVADAGQPYPLDPKFRAQVLADPTKPIHLRLERRGRIVRGYLSADGKDWTLAREITTKFPARISAGVCASINQATGAQVEFTELTLVPVNTVPAVAPAKEK